ncbi:ABC transporter permease [Sphingomonas sp. R-74633]|uniref:ABC transporter permease n=1 Tax=Sphingomonas sp. R-74633 TaxID=2751188 RepID=UPI0015D2E27D|nr:ABC transporter permease [Sphingomonas sp. R-74633]NYT43083.1 ABC transporter permease [Sphingomonas sp. R-74633]
MLDAVLAEALKLRRHRATWMMVWIYPIAIAAIIIGVLLYGALAKHGAAGNPQSAAGWIKDSAILWKVPTSPPGRFLIAGFAAVVFAGEYGWNTWKLIIPARARWQLIVAKWVVALGLLVIALVAADLIMLLGSWIESFQGDKIPDGVTLAAVAKAHWQAGAHALLPIVYTIAFASLFAILTQSILATVILSIALVVLEGMLPLLGFFFYQYAPTLTAWLVKVLPLYHMANLLAWAKGGAAMPLAPGTIISMSWATSFWVLMAWIAAAGAATQFRFIRQDLN